MPDGKEAVHDRDIYFVSGADSLFFDISSKVYPHEQLLPLLVETKRSQVELNPISPEVEFIESHHPRPGQTSVLEATIHLEDFPHFVPLPRMVCLGTPEGLAMTLGRFNQDGIFTPARLDVGVPAQQDIKRLTQDIVQTPQFKEILGDTDPTSMFITDIIRDPHTNLQEAIYDLTGKNYGKTQLHIHHTPDDNPANPFGRFPKACNLKLEGFDPHACKTLAICDPFASGMQIAHAVEVHTAAIARLNGGGHKIEDLVLISPLATLSGTAIIAQVAARYGVRTTVFTGSGILYARPPERYWCPVYPIDEFCAENGVPAIYQQIYGEKACVKADPWCNWAAKRMSPAKALVDSETELKGYGLNNRIVAHKAAKITPNWIEQNTDMKPSQFVPYSTIRGWVQRGSNPRPSA